ncbi:MAG: DUF421 domain-containing protein [Clostridia bacterium]|nr:DUF421 domain-containing protein [Clostridia bacterium]
MIVVVIRTVLMYATLIVAMRLMGKRQLGDLQPTELAVTIMLSDIAVIPLQEPGAPILSGIAPIALLVGLELLMSCIMLKAPRLARVITGNPVVVIRNGRPIWSALRRLRMTVEDLVDGLRELGYFDIEDIETGIVETNGKISVYLKAGKQPMTIGDLQPTVPPRPMSCVVLTDGELNQFGLSLCGWEPEKIWQVLKAENVSPKQVMLMTADSNGAYRIIRKEENQ